MSFRLSIRASVLNWTCLVCARERCAYIFQLFYFYLFFWFLHPLQTNQANRFQVQSRLRMLVGRMLPSRWADCPSFFCRTCIVGLSGSTFFCSAVMGWSHGMCFCLFQPRARMWKRCLVSVLWTSIGSEELLVYLPQLISLGMPKVPDNAPISDWEEKWCVFGKMCRSFKPQLRRVASCVHLVACSHQMRPFLQQVEWHYWMMTSSVMSWFRNGGCRGIVEFKCYDMLTRTNWYCSGEISGNAWASTRKKDQGQVQNSQLVSASGSWLHSRIGEDLKFWNRPSEWIDFLFILRTLHT